MRKSLQVLLAVLLVCAAGTLVSPAQADKVGNEGCTPGYWKTHTDNWEEARPGQLVSKKYSAAAATSLSTTTLLEALQGGGGPGVEGAERILSRAAVAAYLNAAHDDLGYPWRRNRDGLGGRPPLVDTVNAAFASGDRATMLDLATRLDRDNNLGCPLN